jgi:zinc D-Ala-D-Ala carboxypeptidase
MVKRSALVLSEHDAEAALRSLGWPTSVGYSEAIFAFQLGWNLGPELEPDGVVGPLTSDALLKSLNCKKSGQGTASAHFSFTEFACHCGGHYEGCHGLLVRRDLLASLERLRTSYYTHGLDIESGYRCPRRNHEVGGATNSQHQYGAAADVAYAVECSTLAGMHLFSGLGRSASSHLVRHVDRRDISGFNTTGSGLTHPAIWDYAE